MLRSLPCQNKPTSARRLALAIEGAAHDKADRAVLNYPAPEAGFRQCPAPLPLPFLGPGDLTPDLLAKVDQVIAVDHDGSRSAPDSGVPSAVDAPKRLPVREIGLDRLRGYL